MPCCQIWYRIARATATRKIFPANSVTIGRKNAAQLVSYVAQQQQQRHKVSRQRTGPHQMMLLVASGFNLPRRLTAFSVRRLLSQKQIAVSVSLIISARLFTRAHTQ